jgi:Holliday junction resolvasome RuvABC endonuclease subunit
VKKETEKKPKRKKAEKPCYPDEGREQLTILAIDPSYEEFGFSVYEKGQLVLVKKLNFKAIQKEKGEMSKKEKRQRVRDLLEWFIHAYFIDVVVTERARLYSQGFISIDAIAALSELICVIIDTVDMPVVSINTQTWRFHSSGNRFHKKEDTMKWVQETMINKNVVCSKKLTDNETDAVGIGYAFYHGAKSEFER